MSTKENLFVILKEGLKCDYILRMENFNSKNLFFEFAFSNINLLFLF